MPEIKQGVAPLLIDDPYADPTTEAFWEGTRQHKLLAARCVECGTAQLHQPAYCFSCQSRDFAWEELPGTGTIYTYTVVRHPLRPDLYAAVPLVGAIIELDGTQGAGARIMGNVIDCDVDKVRIGDRVAVVFEKISETFTVPRFRLV